jgi:hypothetical protein
VVAERKHPKEPMGPPGLALAIPTRNGPCYLLGADPEALVRGAEILTLEA